ncbi:MAG: hypothetical protein Kow0042_15080 [Calditrichia bacterium]
MMWKESVTTVLSSILITLFIFLMHCGPKVNRAELDADAYFKYAKKLFDKGKYYDAGTEFGVIVLKFSGDPIVDDAQFYLGESHFNQEEYLIAVAEYQKLIEDYPESPYVEQAFYKIGLSYMNMSQRPSLDQQYSHQALRNFQNFIEAYPNSSYRPDAEECIKKLRNKLAKKKLLGANVYRKMGIYDSAIIYYDIVLDDYYDTPSAESALYYKSICQMKLKKYEEALSGFTVFLEKYPNSKYANDAKEKIGDIQEILNKVSLSNNSSNSSDPHD